MKRSGTCLVVTLGLILALSTTSAMAKPKERNQLTGEFRHSLSALQTKARNEADKIKGHGLVIVDPPQSTGKLTVRDYRKGADGAVSGVNAKFRPAGQIRSGGNLPNVMWPTRRPQLRLPRSP
jgi:hypothetical protein